MVYVLGVPHKYLDFLCVQLHRVGGSWFMLHLFSHVCSSAHFPMLTLPPRGLNTLSRLLREQSIISAAHLPARLLATLMRLSLPWNSGISVLCIYLIYTVYGIYTLAICVLLQHSDAAQTLSERKTLGIWKKVGLLWISIDFIWLGPISLGWVINSRIIVFFCILKVLFPLWPVLVEICYGVENLLIFWRMV